MHRIERDKLEIQIANLTKFPFEKNQEGGESVTIKIKKLEIKLKQEMNINSTLTAKKAEKENELSTVREKFDFLQGATEQVK